MTSVTPAMPYTLPFNPFLDLLFLPFLTRSVSYTTHSALCGVLSSTDYDYSPPHNTTQSEKMLYLRYQTNLSSSIIDSYSPRNENLYY